MTEKKLGYGHMIPLWEVVAHPDSLRWHIEELAREYGYGMATTEGTDFTTPMVTVLLRVEATYNGVAAIYPEDTDD